MPYLSPDPEWSATRCNPQPSPFVFDPPWHQTDWIAGSHEVALRTPADGDGDPSGKKVEHDQRFWFDFTVIYHLPLFVIDFDLISRLPRSPVI